MTDSPAVQRKLLSFAIPVRNDNYVKNYAWRVSAILNYIAYGLERIGRLDDAEIIIADWNSPSPMANELNLTPAAQKITRFFDVPPAVALPASQGIPFPSVLVSNSAIRRATGEFILVTDNDCLYSPAGLTMLLHLLDHSIKPGFEVRSACMAIGRRQVPQELTYCFPSIDEIDHYLDFYASLLDEDRISNGTMGWAGSFIMHRSLWDECGAFDESSLYWGWVDIDFVLRNARRYPTVSLSNFGVTAYHLGHPPTYVKNSGKTSKKSKLNLHSIPYPFDYHSNKQNWGQGQYELALYPQPTNKLAAAKLPKSSQEWRLKTLKELKRPIIERQLVSAERRNGVAAHLKDIEKNSEVRISGLTAAGQRNLSGPQTEWDMLDGLAWYCQNLYPLTAVITGAGQGLAGYLAASLYPPISIFGFESWNPFDNPLALHPLQLNKTLSRIKHCGYLRFITDQSIETYQNFWKQASTLQTVDLIVYADAYPADRVLNEINVLIEHLAPGGCFLFHHPSASVFEEVCVTLRKKSKKLAWFFGSAGAMALNINSIPNLPIKNETGASQRNKTQETTPPIPIQQLISRAEQLLGQDLIEDAVQLIKSEIELRPASAELYLLMGRLLDVLDLPRNAQYFYQKAIECAPADINGYLGLSVAAAKHGDLDESEITLQECLIIFPEHPVVMRIMADILVLKNRVPEALEYYKKALQQTPNDFETLKGIANAAFEMDDIPTAYKFLQKARLVVPGAEEARWNEIIHHLKSNPDTRGISS